MKKKPEQNQPDIRFYCRKRQKENVKTEDRKEHV